MMDEMDETKAKVSERSWLVTRAIALALVVFGATLSTAQSELNQALMQGLIKSFHVEKYFKPMFQTYFNATMGSSLFFVWAVWYYLKRRRDPVPVPNEARPFQRVLFLFTLIVSILSTGMFLLLFHAAAITAVSVGSAISNAGPLFTFILSVFFLKEKVTVWKVVALVVTLGGMVMVAYFGSGNKENGIVTSPWGYVMAISGLILASFYTISLSKFFTIYVGFSRETMFLLIGMTGLTVVFTQWPLLIIFHYTHFEVFHWPSTNVVLVFMAMWVGNTIFAFTFLTAIRMTSPIFTSVAGLLTLPISLIFDKFLHNYLMPPLALVGVGILVLGFIMFNLAELYAQRQLAKASEPKELGEHQSLIQ